MSGKMALPIPDGRGKGEGEEGEILMSEPG